ncbi:MAG: DUF21 domain-containing protein, partial [Chloroflexota bacterium]
MDEGSLSSLIAVILLIVLHGGVALAYAAVTNVRHTPLKEQAEKGDKSARRILRLTEDPSRLNTTIQLFLTFVRFAIVAVASISLATSLIRAEDAAGVFLNPGLGYLAVLLPTALVTYLLGEVVPLALGQAYADQLAPIMLSPLRVLMFVLSPLVLLFNNLSRTLSRISGAEDLSKAVTEQEIMTLVDVGQQGGTI